MDQDHELLRFFEFGHLPEHLQQVSRPFHALATRILELTNSGQEQDMALRKLLEAKDCAVRAKL